MTHDQDEALRLSDRIAVFSQGVIDQIASGSELYAKPSTRFVAEFIGDSDFIACNLMSIEEGTATVAVEGSVFSGIPIHGHAVRGTKVDLMLRPERIRLSLDGQAASPSLQATVSDITFLGNNVQVATKMHGEQTIAVRLPFGHETISRLARGVRVNLSFDPAAAQVFAQP